MPDKIYGSELVKTAIVQILVYWFIRFKTKFSIGERKHFVDGSKVG